MRIGIFGGSFNPVHMGHLIAAECAREQAGLDRVVFIPAAVPPHKQDATLAPAEHRLEMLRLAVGGHEAFAISTIELDRGGLSWTVETLATLRREWPDDEFVLLLGPDAVAGLPSWREPEKIAALAELRGLERERLDDLAALT
ncbi:MAG: nicotinate (nicotinamide) nucleotide adenylyltransferase, partial [Planctomycetia bacterium]